MTKREEIENNNLTNLLKLIPQTSLLRSHLDFSNLTFSKGLGHFRVSQSLYQNYRPNI